MSCGFMPRPTDREPCGSKSTSSTLRPYSASAAPRLIVVVVLPTPPFWLHMAMIRAGPWVSRGAGSGNSGIGRAVGPIGRCARSSVVVGSAATSGASAATGASACTSVCTSGCGGGSSTAGTGGATWSGAGPSGGISGWVLTVPSSLSTRRPVAVPTSRATVGSRPARITPPRRAHPDRSAGARVRGGVHLTQPVDRDQRVHLGGRDAGVPQQLLDDPDVGATVEQVGG